MHNRFPEDAVERCIHPGSHALQAAADIHTGTIRDPALERFSLLQQHILHIHLVGLIPRKCQVQACQVAVVQPALQLVAAQQVMRPVTFAEQQPVALLASIHPRAEQAAQAGQAGAIADQYQRCSRFRQVEAAVASQTQAQHTPKR